MRQPHVFALAVIIGSSASFGDTVSLLPSDDTVLFESSPEFNYNFGRQRDAPVGTTAPGNGNARSRGLFRFDIAGAIPAGSTINSGSFSLMVERAPANGVSSTFELRRMLVPWIEGTKANPERPGGAPAAVGEPTWNHREAPSTAWASNGGQSGTDFAAAISGTATVLSGSGTNARGDSFTWPLNPTGVADLQSWLDNPTTNSGWMLLTSSEGTPKTARRFYMKETLTDIPQRQGSAPELIIDYSPPATVDPPEVTSFSLNGEEIALQFVATAGLTYEVQTNSVLEESGWSTFETFNPKSDGVLSSTIPSSALSRIFVRVLASDE